MSFLYEMIQLSKNTESIINRNESLIAGHTLCADYKPGEIGITHRNELG
jgi:hypothetical protein